MVGLIADPRGRHVVIMESREVHFRKVPGYAMYSGCVPRTKSPGRLQDRSGLLTAHSAAGGIRGETVGARPPALGRTPAALELKRLVHFKRSGSPAQRIGHLGNSGSAADITYEPTTSTGSDHRHRMGAHRRR